jgi:hypothetical protein
MEIATEIENGMKHWLELVFGDILQKKYGRSTGWRCSKGISL